MTLLRLALAGSLLFVAVLTPAAEPTDFTGHWEGCGIVPEVCYGYRLVQDGAQVCGTLTKVPLVGDAPAQHGHIRGRLRDSLLTEVFVCGAESRSPCPTIWRSNRRGLLLCGGEMHETGGRVYNCQDMAEQRLPAQYKRVSATAYNQRFGPAPPSLCDTPITPEATATVPPKP
jgi:hypothetical protein